MKRIREGERISVPEKEEMCTKTQNIECKTTSNRLAVECGVKLRCWRDGDTRLRVRA